MTAPQQSLANNPDSSASWRSIVAEHQKPHLGKACWQLTNTLGSYLLLWAAMYAALQVSWWLTFPLAVLAGGILMRVFIIFHDCSHNSFFRSKRANEICGVICGVLTFTPYYHWRFDHALHHASAGDLDRRGIGDVWTLTVQEYLLASRWKRFAYRLARNPFVLFVLAPYYLMIVWQRFPAKHAKPRERRWVHLNNLAIFTVAVGLSSIFGLLPYVILQLLVIGIAGSAGIWLFYVQHQYEDAYWERKENWDYTTAALKGSSFYKLPKVLQWFTGNIGFHHIHHLSPRIPNYNLERCHKSDPLFSEIKPVTLLSSLNSLTVHLWDESSNKLVGFGHLRTLKTKGKSLPRGGVDDSLDHPAHRN